MYALKNSLRKIFALVTAALVLSACASPAIVQNMIVNPEVVKTNSASPHFEEAIAIAQVKRNTKTNTNPILNSKIDEAAFQRALSASLKNNGLHADDESSTKFDLFVYIESFKQPLFGRDYKVTSNIRYKVMEKKTDIIWYEDLISASHITPYSKNGLPVGGMRLANEGAIRENIKKFLISLSKKKIPENYAGTKTQAESEPLSAIQKLHDLQKALDEGLIKNEKYILERDKILNSL